MSERDREVCLSWKEVQKLEVLKEVQAGARSQVSGAAALGVTDRWIRALLKRLKRHGSAGLVHASRGKPSRRRIADSIRERIVSLYRDKYEGFNLTHFREMLQEREGLTPPAREWLRGVLARSGAWKPRRRSPRHRQRRPRRERAGEMLQFDASTHEWLKAQPRFALVGCVDDATGEVVAKFFPAETTEAYLTVLRMVLVKRGVPLSAYTDRHSTFVVNNAKEADLQRARGRILETQVGRALRELGIEWIPAYSPQAKGRVERLWGVFQDRLLHELQLAKIQDLQKADQYLQRDFLPRYNRRFRVAAVRAESAYRPAPLHRVLQSILCWKEPRILGRDYTFTWGPKTWQVLPCPSIPALAGRRIEVRRTLGGALEAWIGEQRLTIKPCSPFRRVQDLRAAEPTYRSRGKVHRPTLSTRLNKS